MKRLKQFKVESLQVQLIVFIICIIVGALYANYAVKYNSNNYNLIFDMFSEKISTTNFLKGELFKFILVKRVQVFFVIWIVGFTFFSVYVNNIITGYFGICFGVLGSAGLLYNSYKGYLLILLLLFPQYLIYVPIYIYLIYKSTQMSKLIYSSRKVTKNLKNNKKSLIEYGLILTLCILFIIVGSLLEVYVNSSIIKWYVSK